MIYLNSFLSILMTLNFMNTSISQENVTTENNDVTIVYLDETVDLKSADFSSPVAVFNSMNKSVYITAEDVDLMAKVVYGESAAEPYTGKVAVASVILNRVISHKFPSTVSGVIKQKGAFSCVKRGQINVRANKACYDAVYEALQGVDPTNNSLFFYNPEIATCSWMKSVKKNNLIEIGNHVFFISN